GRSSKAAAGRTHAVTFRVVAGCALRSKEVRHTNPQGTQRTEGGCRNPVAREMPRRPWLEPRPARTNHRNLYRRLQWLHVVVQLNLTVVHGGLPKRDRKVNRLWQPQIPTSYSSATEASS